MVFFELRDRLNRYFAFSRKETRDLAISVLVVGFIFSFRDWGNGDVIDLVIGLKNFIVTVFVAAISFFVHESVHRIFALMIGFKAEFKMWWGGLITSLVLVFATNGRIQLVLPGGLVLALLMRQRLGEFRYGLNYWENGVISLYGPLSNLGLAFFGKLFLDIFPSSFFFQKLFFLNMMFAICTMLPIPPLDGMNVFFGSRVLYVLSFAGIVVASLLLYLPDILGIWLALVIALIIMGIIISLYYFTFEQPPK